MTEEGYRLQQHWDGMAADHLDRYLIEEVEHPALNPQSVLIRALIWDRFFPGEREELIEQEFCFSACACSALLANRENRFPELCRNLRSGQRHLLPAFMQADTLAAHSGGRFGLHALLTEIEKCLGAGFEEFQSPFEQVWQRLLQSRSPTSFFILETACGSANDYRFLHSYGFAPHLDYSGLDVSTTNIRNARQRFPEILFNVGDACALELPDLSVEVSLAFDLYEHLSLEALETALGEALRVTRDEHWISLFNAADLPYHEIRPVDGYHWNLLSLPKLEHHIQAHGFTTEIIRVAELMESRFEGYRHYNPEAAILIATRA